MPEVWKLVEWSVLEWAKSTALIDCRNQNRNSEECLFYRSFAPLRFYATKTRSGHSVGAFKDIAGTPVRALLVAAARSFFLQSARCAFSAPCASAPHGRFDGEPRAGPVERSRPDGTTALILQRFLRRHFTLRSPSYSVGRGEKPHCLHEPKLTESVAISKNHIIISANFRASCQTLACLAFRRLAFLIVSSAPSLGSKSAQGAKRHVHRTRS
jgi:hypothetical protein